MPGPKRRRASSTDLPALAEALVAEPRAKANNLPVLLAALTPECGQAVPVLHSLRLFFIDSFDRGDLSVQPPEDGDQSPEAVYAAWLHRQYRSYQAALLRLLGGTHPAAEARTQVAAFVALMECVRGERPGVFNNRLYHRLFEALVCGAGAAPEVLGLLISKFLDLADVRFFTLTSIVKIAQRSAAQQRAGLPRGPAQAGRHDANAGADDEEGWGAGSEDGSSGGESEGEDEGAASAGEGGKRVTHADLARTLHDILAGMRPEAPGLGLGPGGASGKHDAGKGEEQEEEKDEEEEGGAAGLRSWCGAAEVGIVAAANAGEGARQRKRQRRLLGQADAGSDEPQLRAKWANAKAQQRMFSDAWLALLRMDFPEDVLKKVLARMHDLIIPSLINPLLLADFLTATLDKGGLTGMLALNGIFLLVTRHGLEYPRFYARLYQLLSAEAFHARYRSRFFALADVFLASGMVPAYTAAAFVKRLARLALAAPPAGALLALAFAHNIVRRHPATMQLLHRPPRGGLAGVAAGAAAPAAPPAQQPLLPLPPQVAAAQGQQQQQQEQTAAANGAPSDNLQHGGQQQQQGPAWQGMDVYDFAEPDPAKSRALESSLWELEALRVHHNPQVAAYCSILDKDLRDRKKTSEVDISELLAASYASMFAAETGRRLKAVPTAFYRTPPERLFEGPAVAADWPGWVL